MRNTQSDKPMLVESPQGTYLDFAPFFNYFSSEFNCSPSDLARVIDDCIKTQSLCGYEDHYREDVQASLYHMFQLRDAFRNMGVCTTAKKGGRK